jgi:hypothetical protein
MMRVFGAVTAMVWLLTGAALAAEVQVTFTLPDAYGDQAVSWSATPLDLPPEADVLNAMTMMPDAFAGPWSVVLTPGEYLISAFSEAEVFELTATLAAQPATQSFEVPVLSLAAFVAYRCDGPVPCRIADDRTGLGFDLPAGWASEQPYFADLGGGAQAQQVSAVFYQDIQGDGGAVWFLNPDDWIDDEAGPCRDVDLGVMCTFDTDAAAEAGFALIAPSLTLVPVAP